MKRMTWLMILAMAGRVFEFSAQAAAPRVAAVSPAPGNVTSLTQITVTFDQPVTGVDARDLLINGRAALSLSAAGAVYTFGFEQPRFGVVEVKFGPGHAINAAGSLFDESGAPWIYQLRDVLRPLVTSIHPPPGSTVRRLTQIEVTFNEPVKGVKAGDLALNGSPASGVSGTAAGPYTFQFQNPPSAGTASVAWIAGLTITDFAEQPNFFTGGDGWTYTINSNANPGDIVISELNAANVTGLADETGEVRDWVELYNRGSTPVNLLGWSLSDNPNNPGRWVFPSVTLDPGKFLVVFASGLDRTATGPNTALHTSFKLGRAGEYLGLFSPESPRRVVHEYSPGYPAQRNDFSYGIETSGQLRYFRTPSPGALNGPSTVSAAVEPVEFSVERGFFPANIPFFLTLSTKTPRAVIRYTLDGTEPTETTGQVYSGPIFISRTTLLRAAAFKANTLPSLVATHTFLFGAGSNVQSLPILSIVTPTNHLFGPNGIMEINPRNTTQHGIAWERPASAEWIRVEDNGGFQIDCGLRVLGGDFIRENYNYNAGPPFGKYSYGLYFRPEYGAGSLRFPAFEHSSLREYERIGLRAGFNDPLNPFINDEMVRRLMLDTGQVAAHGTFVNLLLNGVYKGYYNPVERINSRFLRAWHGGTNEWDVIEQNDNVREGTIVEWQALRDFIKTTDFSAPAAYQEVNRRLDLVNFVDYVLVNVYTATGDWPFNNWRSARERKEGAPWRFYSWDAEHSFGYVPRQGEQNPIEHNSITGELALTFTPVGSFFQQLRVSPEFRLLFADRVQKHFASGGALSETNVLNHYEEMRLQLLGVIPAMNNTIPRIWVPQRKGIVFQHMRAAGLLPSLEAPALSLAAGRVARGARLNMTATGGAVYYTTNGVDPRVPFSSTISPDAKVFTGQPLSIDRSMTVKARAFSSGTWSALAEASFDVAAVTLPVRFTEINYHPPDSESYEFVELQNTGPSPIDLGGLRFGGIDFLFPSGTVVEPGGRVVVASNLDPAGFAAWYPGAAVVGYFNGNLSNGGEKLSLRDSEGRPVTAVDYDDENGWPVEADGRGATLEVIIPEGDPSDPANWRASLISSGTPGAPPVLPPAAVRLNEVMTRNTRTVENGGKYPSWVELANFTDTPQEIGGWSLSNDGNPRKFMVPFGTTLPPRGHLVIWCDREFGAPGIHSGFFITNNTESVFFYNAATQRVDAVTVGLSLPESSVGRAGEEWHLNAPTPGLENRAVPVTSASNLALNEWLANPKPGDEDWLELYNRSTLFPVALRGIGISVNGSVFQVNSLSFIAPGGHVRLIADERPGVDHLNLKLPAAGAELILLDETGARADQVRYGPQAEGVSQGRLPDGSAMIQIFGAPTPGAPNVRPQYQGPVLNEFLARNETAVRDSAGRFADWFELSHPGNSVFDLSGMSVSVGVPQPGQWRFPNGTALGPGGHLVVWCDPLRPASILFDSDLNCGLRLDGEGGGIYLFDRNDQMVDRVDFGFQVSNLSVGRIGADWRLLAAPSPGVPNPAAANLGSGTQLKVNEWLADPASGDDWFEIYNAEPLTVALGGFVVSDDPSIAGQSKFVIPPLSFIGADRWIVFTADGQPQNGPEHVNFRLSAAGETIRVYNASRQQVDSVNFGLQEVGVSQGRLPDGSVNIANFRASASPRESNYLPLADVVINEVLSHAFPPYEQAIELYNPTAQPVNIGGFYLSNDGRVLQKFRIPDGTILPPRSFKVYYENQFNAFPNAPSSFKLSAARGGAVHLSAVDRSGGRNGFQAVVRFSAAEGAVSFGRVETSLGSDFVPMVLRSFGRDSAISLDDFRGGTGLSNSAPQVGPLVISEIHYHPVIPQGTQLIEEDREEFIELQNVSSAPVLLFDPARQQNRWQLRGEVTFTPTGNVILQPRSFALIVSFDPVVDSSALSAFRSKYSVPDSVPILGPFQGRLNNAGGLLELYKPDSPSSSGPDAGVVPYVLVDRIAYSGQLPWPFEANGTGASLQRQNNERFGNDPVSWAALPPTAGLKNSTNPITDADADGLPDAWETANRLNPADPSDAQLDIDGDGLTNLQEFRAGTNPRDPASRLELASFVGSGGEIVLLVNAAAGKTYSIQFTDQVGINPWQTFADINADAAARTVEVTDSTRSGVPIRFYRLVTPRQ